jgi:hypothetical protein
VGFLVLLFFFGLATGVIGKIKGSSFFIWFLIGFCLPIVGLIGALLYRWESQEPRRRCPRCDSLRRISDQVCTVCGEDLDWPEREDVVPAAQR